MIIWSGLGFLVVVFAFGCSLVMNLITNAVFQDESYFTTERWPLSIALVAAGVLSWLVGKYVNNRQARIMIDKATGREVAFLPNHSLFFIKMHYWGPIFVALGFASLFFR
jgi:hypothetical protein